MIEQVTTVNGSVYEIDREAGTWKRVSWPEWSTGVRSDGGTYLGVAVQPGEPLVIIAEPLSPVYDIRIITTSRIVKIETREEGSGNAEEGQEKG